MSTVQPEMAGWHQQHHLYFLELLLIKHAHIISKWMRVSRGFKSFNRFRKYAYFIQHENTIKTYILKKKLNMQNLWHGDSWHVTSVACWAEHHSLHRELSELFLTFLFTRPLGQETDLQDSRMMECWVPEPKPIYQFTTCFHRSWLAPI